MVRVARAACVVAVGLLLASIPLGGRVARAAFYGSNGLVAYTCGGNICVVNPGSSSSQLITGGTDPAWSHDGLKLAWIDTASGQIKVQSVSNGALTGSATTLTQTSHATQPTWSSNSLYIAYVETSPSQQIEVAYVSNGNAPRALLDEPRCDGHRSSLVSGRNEAGVRAADLVPLPDHNGLDGLDRHRERHADEAHVPDPGRRPPPELVVRRDEDRLLVEPGRRHDEAPVHDGLRRDEPDAARLRDRRATPHLFAGRDEGRLRRLVGGGHGKLQTVTSSGGSQTTIDSGTTNNDPDWQVASSSGGGTSSTAPSNSTIPSVSVYGTSTQLLVGSTVYASVGSWTGTYPITYTYQWKRSASPPTRSTGPATRSRTRPRASTRCPTRSTAGGSACSVTATNSVGSKRAYSVATDVVGAPVAPRLARDAADRRPNGRRADAVGRRRAPGTARPRSTFAYEWRRCDPHGDARELLAIPARRRTPTSRQPTTSVPPRVYITGTNLVGSEVSGSRTTRSRSSTGSTSRRA